MLPKLFALSYSEKVPQGFCFMVNYDHFLKKSEIYTPYNNVLTDRNLGQW